ncbi:MAG TPA: LytR C-terminal domain-containing protein [Gemmatimonadales bacterium]|nr:LytR C-terminal domain-containing protein [Gemmatimonadales bacterium]
MRNVVVLTALLGLCGCGGDGPRTPPTPGDRGPAVTVEVLNANGRAGDARVGTRILRRSGIDVVYFGNAGESTLDSTRIIVRRGSASVGEKVREALGQGRIEIQLDSSKLLDVSVLLGADFAPSPARAGLEFHP